MTQTPGDDLERRRRRRRTRRKALLVVLCGALAVLSVVFRKPWFQGNFGVVDRGRVFRSAQPAGTLAGLIRRQHLASVLNLRGGTPADPWYAEEVRVTTAEGVDFYDFPMNATRRPTRFELLVLIDLFGRCRYPLLIHCKSGSDRTGLAAAVYRMVAAGDGPARAARAFTVAHGHVPLFGTRHLHEPLDEYAAWLAACREDHTPVRFRWWVENEYRSDGPFFNPPPLATGPRLSGSLADTCNGAADTVRVR